MCVLKMQRQPGSLYDDRDCVLTDLAIYRTDLLEDQNPRFLKAIPLFVTFLHYRYLVGCIEVCF